MRRYWIGMAVMLSLVLFLTGCGGAGPATNLSVTMTEFMFTPNEFTVPAGQDITLELTNNGTVTHDFIIMKQGTEVDQDFGDEDVPNVYWKTELEAGSSGTFTFTAPSEPGEYQVLCGVAGHYMAGMVGKLIVVSQ